MKYSSLKKIFENVNSICIIYEGLNYTHSMNNTVNQLTNFKFLNNAIIHKDMDRNVITIKLNKMPYEDIEFLLNHKSLLIKRIDMMGWFISRYLVRKKIKKYNENNFFNDLKNESYKKKIDFSFILEAKYDKELERDNLFNILYHVTPSVNVTKILENGLLPKALNKTGNYPERIYLTTDVENAELLAEQFKKIDSNIDKYTILKIDMKELNKRIDFKLFQDPMMISGYYTYYPINPKYIKPIKNITI